MSFFYTNIEVFARHPIYFKMTCVSTTSVILVYTIIVFINILNLLLFLYVRFSF